VEKVQAPSWAVYLDESSGFDPVADISICWPSREWGSIGSSSKRAIGSSLSGTASSEKVGLSRYQWAQRTAALRAGRAGDGRKRSANEVLGGIGPKGRSLLSERPGSFCGRSVPWGAWEAVWCWLRVRACCG